jgi:predicted MFS family arabinose efflux permease
VAAGGMLLLLCFVVIALAPVWGVTVPAILLLGLGYYMLHNTLQTHATEMAPEARGSAVSSFAFCLFLGQAVGVSLLGFVVEWAGYRAAIAATGVGLALLGTWFGRELRRF